jgi:hypothetical protein
MKRYWPVAACLFVLLAAAAFLFSSRSAPQTHGEAVAPTQTPAGTATPRATPLVAGPPGLRPYPLVTPIGTPGPDVAVESGRGMWLSKNLQLHAVLSVLAGDTSLCANLCPLPLSPQETLAVVLSECGRYDPSGFRVMWANYPEILLQLNSNVSACRDLKAANDLLGAFSDTQAWRDILHAIIRGLQTTVAGRQLPQLPGSVATPEPPIQSVAGFHPRGTFTGIAPVDKFLRVLYTGDLAHLADDAVFPRLPCVPPTVVKGGPYCPPGVGEGAPVGAMPFGSCSPNFVFTRDQLRERLSGKRDEVLYAVYEGGRYGTYGVAVTTPLQAQAALAYYLDDAGRLVAFIACGGPLGQTPGANVLFPPRGG